MTTKEYNYWLANIRNIGIKKIDQLLRYFKSAEELFYAGKEELLRFQISCSDIIRITTDDIDTVIQSKNRDKIRNNYAKLEKSGIYFVSREEEGYPEKLRHIYDAPFAIYVKGKLPRKEEKILAVVGARECSQYGKEMAAYLVSEIAKEGISIISGLARGIDSYAHQGALLSGGITYAVLGSGIDTCYPKENINLYRNMQNSGGIISEYAPGVTPFAGNFPMRNRIISGMSDGILVLEAREKSGSLITVDMGLEQGKEIYALPGRISDQLSIGCNNLIKMGAKLVTSPKDILEEMIPNYQQSSDKLKKNNKILETNGKIVYACLSLEPMHIEEIAYKSGLKMDLLMEQLLYLELSGYARQTMKNYYVAQN